MKKKYTIEKLRKRLERKIIVITGKNEMDRKLFINEVIKDIDFDIYRTPKLISFIDYVSFIRKKTGTLKPFDRKRKLDFWYNFSFHNECLIDNSCLIILEELSWDWTNNIKVLVLRYFIEIFDTQKKGQKFPRLILSQDDLSDINKYILRFPSNNYLTTNRQRSSTQIINRNIDFVDITNY